VPLLLDLFCGVGGAAMGYYRAGFNIIGVDHVPQPNYPFPQITADALHILRTLAFDNQAIRAIHASPPCQRYSDATGTGQSDPNYPDYIPETRRLLRRTGKPYVIENVRGAPLINKTFICGTRLGLRTKADNGQVYRLRRHRYFETNWALKTPGCSCARAGIPVMDVTGGGARSTRQGRTYRGGADDRRAIMGIPWATNRKELAEAVPPAYTELIGRQLLYVVKGGTPWVRQARRS
jgi:DNA (cytosine-5)-methyltransferase 1